MLNPWSHSQLRPYESTDIFDQETDSQEHSLSTIQASMLACTVLACSENEFGFKVVSVYLARTILVSMLCCL